MFKVCPRKMLRKPLVYKIYFYPFTYNAFILTRFLFYIRENMPSLNATPIFANLCAITFQGNASNSLQQDAFFFVDEKVANAPVNTTGLVLHWRYYTVKPVTPIKSLSNILVTVVFTFNAVATGNVSPMTIRY